MNLCNSSSNTHIKTLLGKLCMVFHCIGCHIPERTNIINILKTILETKHPVLSYNSLSSFKTRVSNDEVAVYGKFVHRIM